MSGTEVFYPTERTVLSIKQLKTEMCDLFNLEQYSRLLKHVSERAGR